MYVLGKLKENKKGIRIIAIRKRKKKKETKNISPYSSIASIKIVYFKCC